ncbi:hypothetical protein DFH06DRAFT_1379184 [Mycena polygramma]|nr:hypothetical protein DFH06DRAFT_1379184 [Mycena polygramma]
MPALEDVVSDGATSDFRWSRTPEIRVLPSQGDPIWLELSPDPSLVRVRRVRDLGSTVPFLDRIAAGRDAALARVVQGPNHRPTFPGALMPCASCTALGCMHEAIALQLKGLELQTPRGSALALLTQCLQLRPRLPRTHPFVPPPEEMQTSRGFALALPAQRLQLRLRPQRTHQWRHLLRSCRRTADWHWRFPRSVCSSVFGRRTHTGIGSWCLLHLRTAAASIAGYNCAMADCSCV